jgi:hypothetical protein
VHKACPFKIKNLRLTKNRLCDQPFAGPIHSPATKRELDQMRWVVEIKRFHRLQGTHGLNGKIKWLNYRFD